MALIWQGRLTGAHGRKVDAGRAAGIGVAGSDQGGDDHRTTPVLEERTSYASMEGWAVKGNAVGSAHQNCVDSPLV